MTPEQEQVLLDITAQGLDRTLSEAYRAMIDRINAGTAPRDAVADALKGFEGEYAQLLADGFSAILARSIGTESVLAMQVSGVSLSRHLYAQNRQTAATVAGLIERHAKGFHDVRQLTLDIYEGYGFKDKEALNLSPRNPKLPQYLRKELLTDTGLAGELSRHFTRVQAAGLKTPALRASYLAAVKAMEQGIGQDVLDKRLRIAFHERMRYFANRIAQTELHRAYADRQAVELMDDQGTAFVRWRMSGTHPKTDICDYFAKVDKYGLGAGIYPKAKAPKAPAHPYCRCILVPLTGMPASTPWKERKGADQEWLKAQGLNEGASIMGSKARRDAVLKGADPTEVHNSRSNPLYRVQKVGDVDGTNWPKAMQAADNGGMNEDKSIRTALASSAFDQFFNASNGAPSRFAVAHLTQGDRALFGCRGDTLWLSRHSLDEHKNRHPEVSIDDYRAIPDVVRNGDVWAGHSKDRYLLLWVGGKPYRAAIKTDAQGEEAWFLSLVVSTKQKPPKGAVRVR